MFSDTRSRRARRANSGYFKTGKVKVGVEMESARKTELWSKKEFKRLLYILRTNQKVWEFVKNKKQLKDGEVGKMQYTSEQEEIIAKAVELFKNGTSEILKVNALAGTGKTTTMLAVSQALVNAGAENILYLVFNKHMQSEIESKIKNMGLSSYIKAKTINAVAYHFARKKRFRHIQTAYDYAINYKEFKEYQNFCKYYKDGNNGIYNELLRNKELDFQGEVRFLADNAHYLEYDAIILDESQDVNPCMLAFFKKAKAKLKIAVGDANQSIYLFNGAINAMKIIQTDHSLNLTASFRTRNKEVQELVNVVLQLIDAKNPFYAISSTQPTVGTTTVYLTRTNAAAIKHLQLLDEKGENAGINASKDMIETIDDLLLLMRRNYSKRLPKISLWDVEVAVKMMSNNFTAEEGSNSDNMLYEYALLYSLVDGDVKELKSLKDLIELYKVDPTKLESVDTYITTAHRFKGLQAPYAYIDTKSFEKVLERYREALKSHSDTRIKKIIQEYIKQEYNLFYIALTRAINGIKNIREAKEYIENVLLQVT